ncbi:MAG: sigma-70 family RNA polymerase sigma factor [Clostridia bacterium]|nr:sigma-70 family RNA polymerase sigma factor [Clostridia bacterium]
MEKRKHDFDPSFLELIYKAARGNQDAFCSVADRYQPMIKRLAAGFDVPETERDDLAQEGLIGLYKAVMTYDPELSGFGTYAWLCVKRSMISALRAMNRDAKEVSSLDADSCPDLPDPNGDPQAIFGARESYEALLGRIDACLSPYENSVLRLFLAGSSHDRIAAKLGTTRKSVDNAICRIRRKIRSVVE